MPLSNLPRVMHEADAAVLVVDLDTSRVEYANLKAVAMAGHHPLPLGVDEWGRLAGLVDPSGEDLAATNGPLSRVARGEPVAGELIRREPDRASDAAGDEQDRQTEAAGGVAVDDVVGPLWVTGFPLGAELGNRALLVFMRLTGSARAGLALDPRSAADRAAAEAAQQAAALRDRAVIATDLSFTISDPAREDNPLVWVNPAFTRTTGYEADDVLGLNCRFLQGPDTDRAAVARIRAALEAGEPIVETLLNYRKDGTAFWNQVSISPVLDPEGKVVNFVGVQADVTERVLVQEQREQALAAEKRARAGLVLLDRVSDAVIELDASASLTRLARVLTETIAPWAAVLQLDRNAELVAASGPGLPELVGAQRRVGPPPEDVVGEDPLRAVLEGSVEEVVIDLGRPQRTGSVTGWFAETVAGRAGGRYVALPLAGRGPVIAVLLVGLGGGADGELAAALTADEDQRKLIRVAARRTGLALENARLYAREHSLAETLQRSMLPERSSIPGLDVWAHYMPNVDHAQVGGDWFDVLPIADDIAGVVVGDVVGHDVEAAATMGQLRSVVRSYAYELEDPGSVLMRVDHLASGMGMARMASVVLMTLHRRDDGEWDLSWSSAGHLPPLLCTPQGEDVGRRSVEGYAVRPLDDAVGTLIGLLDGPRASGTVRLRPGDVVVAYTDGLIERRSRPMPVGLSLLQEVLAGTRSGTAELVGEHLLAELGDSPEDDTAVVVLRVPHDATELPPPRTAAPRQRRWQLPSDPSSVGKARHATLRACAVWGVPRAEVAEVVVSELVANAVLHGWGVVQLRLFDAGTGLRVEVEDGNPEPPRLVPARPLGEGGHGLHVVTEVARWGWSPTRSGKLVWAHLPFDESLADTRHGRPPRSDLTPTAHTDPTEETS